MTVSNGFAVVARCARRRDVRPHQHRHRHNSVIVFGARIALPEVYQNQRIEVRSELDSNFLSGPPRALDTYFQNVVIG